MQRLRPLARAVPAAWRRPAVARSLSSEAAQLDDELDRLTRRRLHLAQPRVDRGSLQHRPVDDALPRRRAFGLRVEFDGEELLVWTQTKHPAGDAPFSMTYYFRRQE